MSYPIKFSLIAERIEVFDNYYNGSINRDEPDSVQKAIEGMTRLSGEINAILAAVQPHVSGFFSFPWVTQEVTVDRQGVIDEIEKKLGLMIEHSTKISAPSLAGRAEAIPPPLPPRKTTPPPSLSNSQPIAPPQNPKTNATDYAVGFANMSNNCWANALLSMVFCVPSLKEVYLTIAIHYAQKPSHDPEKKYGVVLLNALEAYKTALAKKQPVSNQISQDVRGVFHAFCINPNTGESTLSADCNASQDAHEALQKLMEKYEQVIEEKNPQNPAFLGLYCPLQTIRHYCAIGEQRNPTTAETPINADNTSRKFDINFQILLDMQNSNHLSFTDLLANVFRDTTVVGSENSNYLLPNGKEQSFQLIETRCQFAHVPNEFILTLKRFASDHFGNSYKVSTPTAINRMISLPNEATTENKPIAYELDSFIVHSGGAGGGHYINYKKIEGRWIEVNDDRVRFVDPIEIDQILHGEKGADFTSYVHHYSRIPQAQQQAALIESINADSPIVKKYTQQRLDAQFAIQVLEDLSGSLQEEKSGDCLKIVPLEILQMFRHAIWLNDKTPDINNYGTDELNKNPKKVLDIKLPWLIGNVGTSLLDQMLIIQKKKLEITSEQLSEALLQAFIAKLNNPNCSNEQLHLAFKALPDAFRFKLQELIYLAHKTKFGAEKMAKLAANIDYGAVTLSGGDLRKTLKEAHEAVLNTHGNNIVEQLAASHRIKAERLQFTYEKEQLQAFRELLIHNPSDLTTTQLAKAFERLDINNSLKEKLYMAIWVEHKMPEVTNYGGLTFTKDPRRCLAIKTPILAAPPVGPEGSDILQQVIALLS